jgi:hypothetical protein
VAPAQPPPTRLIAFTECEDRVIEMDPPVTPNLSRRDHPLVNEYAAAAHILGT